MYSVEITTDIIMFIYAVYLSLYLCMSEEEKNRLFICVKCAGDELPCNFSSDNSTAVKINIAVEKPWTMVARSQFITRKMRFLQYFGSTNTDVVAFVDRVCKKSCLFMVSRP